MKGSKDFSSAVTFNY